MSTYQEFLDTKRLVAPTVGIEIPEELISDKLFAFQKALVYWSLRKGRNGLFAGTGLGKTAMQLEWSRHVHERTNENVLILAPLGVARQTVREGEKFGIEARYCRAQSEVRRGITVTNYEMLHRFDISGFGAVVLDESSILKNFSGKVKRQLIQTFREIPLRLCCTATPAPNDVVELCNHADFLSVMSSQEMMSTFFTPKGQDSASGQFRLKGHARNDFWRWLASWSMTLSKPSDLGFSDGGFALPPLEILPSIVESDWKPSDKLFFTELHGVTERAEVRRATIEARVERTYDLVTRDPQQWLVWCGLNDEGRLLKKALGRGEVIEGSDSPERKAEVLEAFADGQVQILLTKPSIAGFGLNFQSCARMAFLGLSDSYEQYFQAIRRCWRFGQLRPVKAYIVLSEIEQAVYDNVLRKEAEALEMQQELVKYVSEFERAEISSAGHHIDYEPNTEMEIPRWLQPVKS